MKTNGILLLAALILSVVSCKSEQKQEPEDIIAPKYERPAPSSPIRMQENVQKTAFSLAGKALSCEIVRRADDNIAKVKDAIGQEYVDNSVTVNITQEGGGVFYTHTFTKNDFKSLVSNTFLSESILDGIAFSHVEDDTAFFGVSVAIPQTDEFVPLIITLTKDGKTNILQDTEIDTGSEDY